MIARAMGHTRLTVLLFVVIGTGSISVIGAVCTPEAVKDDLQKCLHYQAIGTYYQFPIVAGDSYYRNFCVNTTCMAYCMQLVATACESHSFSAHIGNGDGLVASYLGLCDQLEADVKAFLTCGSTIDNQMALNNISSFQTTLQNYYTNSSENTTVICSDWSTLKTALEVMVDGACSGTGNTIWKTFLNTVGSVCDETLTPSWFVDYKDTRVNKCSNAVQILVGQFHLIQILFITCLPSLVKIFTRNY